MNTPLVKRAYNLGLKAVPNFVALSEEQITYYEEHLNELPMAVSRGFVLPGADGEITTVVEPQKLVVPQDLAWWLGKAQEFAKAHLGVEIDLVGRFAIPPELLVQNLIPVFDPGTLTNREMFELLKKMGYKP